MALALRQPEDDEDDEDSSDGRRGTLGMRTATRSQRMLRTLVEDTALFYADLHPADAEYARGQRSWLAGHASDMTGGTVEIREEGMLLRLPPDRPASVAATVPFPAATATPWFALKMLEAVVTGRSPDNDGRIPLTPDEVETAAERVYTGDFGALTNDLKKSPLVMLAAVEPTLTEAGLIRVSNAGWTVLPVAGRYRDPKAVWEPTLEDMTLEELTSWRVAAIEGQLPEPVRPGRWQPLRAGVVNLWEYDTVEVWYADGRMQLQGANESGKSTLMTLTTLLLLAGEITSHNIDTLGQNDKRFRYYVEPTDHPLDRRDTSAQKNRGWAWLEFGRGAQADREADFFTVLLFAETRRADTNMTVSWCTLRGQTRVRSRLSLTTAGFVADPARFKEVPGFMAHPTGTAYRETIARVLYDTDEAWLNQLNRILRVVRTPQIGHKIDLKFLTQAFRTALPPIAQDEVNQLADGWEQLQRLRDERDEADQALIAVTDFSRRS